MSNVPRTVHHGTLTGAGLGILGFLARGLVPAFQYGKHAGGLLAGGIFHDVANPPLAYTLLVHFTAFMVMMGIASLFTVLGAVAGTAIGQIFHNVAGAPAPKHPVAQPATTPPAAGTEKAE